MRGTWSQRFSHTSSAFIVCGPAHDHTVPSPQACPGRRTLASDHVLTGPGQGCQWRAVGVGLSQAHASLVCMCTCYRQRQPDNIGHLDGIGVPPRLSGHAFSCLPLVSDHPPGKPELHEAPPTTHFSAGGVGASVVCRVQNEAEVSRALKADRLAGVRCRRAGADAVSRHAVRGDVPGPCCPARRGAGCRAPLRGLGMSL